MMIKRVSIYLDFDNIRNGYAKVQKGQRNSQALKTHLPIADLKNLNENLIKELSAFYVKSSEFYANVAFELVDTWSIIPLLDASVNKSGSYKFYKKISEVDDYFKMNLDEMYRGADLKEVGVDTWLITKMLKYRSLSDITVICSDDDDFAYAAAALIRHGQDCIHVGYQDGLLREECNGYLDLMETQIFSK